MLLATASATTVGAAGAADPPGSSAVLRAGTPCSTAADVATCETAFAALTSDEALRPPFDEGDYMRAGFEKEQGGPYGYYLVQTKGDTVGKISNRTELRALVPVVDTPEAALVYANAAGYRVECQRATDGWIRPEAGGWVLRASRDHDKRCSRTDVLLFLRPDGSTEEWDVIEKQPDACT